MSLPRPSLIPYLTAGWPDRARFVAAARGAGRAGCPLFEVGFPFTDPVADGPVIQKTSTEALAAGVDLAESLRLTREAVDAAGIPAVVMTYANLVYRPGPERFCRDIAAAGAVGLIVPDLPLEEGEELEQAASEAGVDLVYLCSPTTPAERVALLGRRTRGFLYLVSVRGVTGARNELPPDLGEYIARVKSQSEAPVCVGFGISTPEQAAAVAAHADGVIVGSALLRRLGELPAEGVEEGVNEYLASLLRAMRSATLPEHRPA